MRLLITFLMLMSGPAPVAEARSVQARSVYQREAPVDRPAAFVRKGDWEISRRTWPERRTGFAATEIVPSWTADTPPGTWLRVELKVPGSGWYVMGRWSYGEAARRTSVKGQSDGFGRVVTDVFKAREPVTAYRLRTTLHREPGSAVRTPALRTLGAVASAPGRARAGGGGVAWGRELKVPRKSQLAHADHGGRAWCSPTSTAMVLGFWGRGPKGKETSWVKRPDPDPMVDHAARHTYDRAYAGTGNWVFNTAYAGRFGLDAFVTRLTSLAALEELIAAGVPVVTSQSFTAKELGYTTEGHLMVVVGFTAKGDVIANDPAVRGVRAVYPRAVFEKVWLRSSTGTVYVIRPPGHPLPAGLVTE